MSFSRIGAYADGVVFKEYYQEELCTRQKISTNQFSWVWGLKN